MNRRTAGYWWQLTEEEQEKWWRENGGISSIEYVEPPSPQEPLTMDELSNRWELADWEKDKIIHCLRRILNSPEMADIVQDINKLDHNDMEKLFRDTFLSLENKIEPRYAF